MFYWELTVSLPTVPLIKSANRLHERACAGKGHAVIRQANKVAVLVPQLFSWTSPEGCNFPKSKRKVYLILKPL